MYQIRNIFNKSALSMLWAAHYPWVSSLCLLILILLAALSLIAPVEQIDYLTEQQTQQRLQEFIEYHELRLPVIMPDAWLEAISTLSISAQAQRQLYEQVRLGEVRLAQLKLWDDLQTDGDSVRVLAGQYTHTVHLSDKAVTVVFPIPPSQTILVQGTHDGEGGITVALSSPTQTLMLPKLTTGQSVSIGLIID